MSRGPKAVALGSTEAERAELRRLLRRRGVGQALAQRIRIVLACAEPGAANLGVAEALGVSRQTVATWRGRSRHRAAATAEQPAQVERHPGPARLAPERVEERRQSCIEVARGSGGTGHRIATSCPALPCGRQLVA